MAFGCIATNVERGRHILIPLRFDLVGILFLNNMIDLMEIVVKKHRLHVLNWWRILWNSVPFRVLMLQSETLKLHLHLNAHRHSHNQVYDVFVCCTRVLYYRCLQVMGFSGISEGHWGSESKVYWHGINKPHPHTREPSIEEIPYLPFIPIGCFK